VGFAVYEAKIASSPILLFNIWRAPPFGLLMLVIFFAFMSLGIFLWYCTIFMINLRHDSLIQVGVQFLPLTILETCAAFIAAWMVPRLPAQAIIGIGCTAMLTCSILLATTPIQQTYWAMLFPALVIISFTADLIFASSQTIASNAVDRAHQGVAGSLVGTLLTYGMSTGLGFAGAAEVYTNNGGKDVLRGLPVCVLLGNWSSCCCVDHGCGIVRMPKDQREGWGEEDNHPDMEMKRSKEGYGGQPPHR
jgi:MFS family permease